MSDKETQALGEYIKRYIKKQDPSRGAKPDKVLVELSDEKYKDQEPWSDHLDDEAILMYFCNVSRSEATQLLLVNAPWADYTIKAWRSGYNLGFENGEYQGSYE